MTSKQRVETVLRGGTPDRVPVCLHNFLPAAAEAGIRLEDYLSDPECAARAHLEAVEKYGHECILIDLDTTMLAEAMGAGRDATPNAPGHIAGPAVTDLADLDGIRVVYPHKDGRIPVLLEAVRIMAAKAGDRVAIRANADQCAFSLAALLRGMEDFFMDLMDEEEHEHARQLLELCYQIFSTRDARSPLARRRKISMPWWSPPRNSAATEFPRPGSGTMCRIPCVEARSKEARNGWGIEDWNFRGNDVE